MTGGATASPMRATVTTLSEARAAIAASIAQGQMADLESPPRAAIIHGILWFAEMQRALSVDFSPENFRLTLDCGDRADLAHAALAEGMRRVRLNCHPTAMAAIRDIASQLGAEVVAGEPA